MKKLTRSQLSEVQSLIIDGGYTRKEAIAWVTAFPYEPEGVGRGTGFAPGPLGDTLAELVRAEDDAKVSS